jgi:Uma2 family endonuclease
MTADWRALEAAGRSTAAPPPPNLDVMDTVLDRAWTADTFLAWDDRQEGKHEFDGRTIIAMTGGSVAHQDIVFNVRTVLGRLLAGQRHRVLQEMRLRVGEWVRYPDVLVCSGRPDQTTRTITDAVAIVEVVSEITAATDRVQKLRDYADVPSLRAYLLLEQTAIAATLYLREPGGPWIATAHTDGEIALPCLGVTLPLADCYAGLEFAPQG